MNPSRWEPWAQAAGFALLYTSTYYLPHVGEVQHYWYPYIGQEILYPSLIGTLILIPFGYCIQSRYLRSNAWRPLEQIAIVALALAAVVSAFSAVGYSMTDLMVSLDGSGLNASVLRRSRVIAFVIAFLVIAITIGAVKQRRAALLRLLSTLGYAYAILALIRVAPSIGSDLHSNENPSSGISGATMSAAQPVRPREVVWIIFDELDFKQTLGAGQHEAVTPMPNLLTLSRLGISASDAYSPARDTEVSLPSLLLGQVPTGVRENRRGLSIHTRDGSFEPFDEAHSVFARLPGGPASGALLGFYHPYCSVLRTVEPCTAMPFDNVGRWFDALLPFGQTAASVTRWIPGFDLVKERIFDAFEPMYRISKETIRQYPHLLELNDRSLVFLHVNLPHPPGDYSQRVLHLHTVANEQEEYRRNLLLVDKLVGTTLAILQQQAKTRDILLIVSSDHWHRVNSPHAMQPIPWIAWHVGETGGATLVQRISTVHTAELALDFLHGNISSQQDIPAWWQNKTFYPPLMPEHYRD